MENIVEVSAFRCRVWHLHERLEEHVSERTCEAEIRSFEAHGQLVPAIGRRIVGEPDYDVEIICGLRRLFVARHLNKPLAVELRRMSDSECFVAMDMENRQRKEVSAYERGLSYTRWLRAGYFQSQDDLARALGISASQVSRLLKLARLPSVIVNAFKSATEICEGWGGELADALDDPRKRTSLIRAARDMTDSSRRHPARDVYRQLLASIVEGRKPKLGGHDQVVKDGNGTPVFRIRRQVSSIALIFPVDKVSEQSLRSIQKALLDILEDTNFLDSEQDVPGTSDDLRHFAAPSNRDVIGMSPGVPPI